MIAENRILRITNEFNRFNDSFKSLISRSERLASDYHSLLEAGCDLTVAGRERIVLAASRDNLIGSRGALDRAKGRMRKDFDEALAKKS